MLVCCRVLLQISLDRRSIEHYRKVKRIVVFSHEELLSGMAEVPDKLEVNVLVAAYREMKKAVELEEERRQTVCAKVVTQQCSTWFNRHTSHFTILVETHL